jgi:DNA-binding MarR family transcriptional regulator
MGARITDEASLKRTEASLMFGITHQLGMYHNRVLEPHGITGKQGLVLSYLLFNPAQQFTQRDLERKFNLRSSTINSVLNYLEKGGFLKRTVSDEDGRAKIVTATEKGNQMLEIILQLFQEESEMIIKGFTPAEQKQFQGYLYRVMANIGEGNTPENEGAK